MNTAAPWPTLEQAEARVLNIQAKLHQWATDDPSRRFDDLYNLVCDPAFLVVAWERVRRNKGARTAGVDGVRPRAVVFPEMLLAGLLAGLKARVFRPMLVRERLIPKPGGKQRRLGIAATRDRVVQAALKLVLEPIWEVDFQPCSYGFRPNAAPGTRSPRPTTWHPAPTSGCWRATSRRVLTSFHTPPSWRGCGLGSPTSACWR